MRHIIRKEADIFDVSSDGQINIMVQKLTLEDKQGLLTSV